MPDNEPEPFKRMIREVGEYRSAKAAAKSLLNDRRTVVAGLWGQAIREIASEQNTILQQQLHIMLSNITADNTGGITTGASVEIRRAPLPSFGQMADYLTIHFRLGDDADIVVVSSTPRTLDEQIAFTEPVPKEKIAEALAAFVKRALLRE